MNAVDLQYKKLIQKVLEKGVWSDNRTGTRTLSIFGEMVRFNMQDGFPLLTTKKMHIKGVIHELLWFLQGKTNIKYLVDNGVNIWNADAYRQYKELTKPKTIIKNGKPIRGKTRSQKDISIEEFVNKIKEDSEFAEVFGELGPVYGKQWTNWNSINQIKEIINILNENPDSRRIMVNAWNVSEIGSMCLPPCHYGFQLSTRLLTDGEKNIHIGKERAVSLMWLQRSVDTGLGLPYNLTSYSFLLNMISQQVNMVPDELIGSLGNVHVYENHIDALKEQISRESYELPFLKLNKAKDIFSYSYDDFQIQNYKSHPAVKMEISV